MAVKKQPEGYHSVTPYIVVDGAEKLISFMTQAFGAKERMRMPGPGGKLMHAEVEIGDSTVMLSDVMPENPATPGMIHLYVDEVDATYKKAMAAGAKSGRAPEDRFYGDRAADVRDAFGNRWSLATHIEDVSEEEMGKRMAAMA